MDTQELLQRYLENKCTEEEARDLLFRIRSGKDKAIVEKFLDEIIAGESPSVLIHDEHIILKEAFSGIVQRIAVEKKRSNPWYRYSGVAAAVALVTFGVLYFVLREPGRSAAPNSDVAISSTTWSIDRSQIRLADGNRVDLEGLPKGVIYQGATFRFLKTGPNTLSYELKSKTDPSTDRTHSVVVGFGENYEVLLPDGTSVKLNAGSKFDFSESFGRNSRRSALTGEGFFNVAKDPTLPFSVDADKISVTVLGTSFNVRAYKNDPAPAATLVEGVIEAGGGEKKVRVRPGEEVSFSANEGLVTRTADIHAVLGWNDNVFRFSGNTIHAVLTQIANWYGLELQYPDGKIPDVKIGGEIPRSSTKEITLEILKTSGLKVRLFQNRLIVNM